MKCAAVLAKRWQSAAHPCLQGVAKRTRTTFERLALTWYKDPLLEVPPGSAHSATEVASARFLRRPGPKRRAKNIQKQHPSAAPGPFSQTGFPRLCSLFVVICVFFAIWDMGNQPNHNVQRAQTGETFWATRAWRCRRVLFLKFLAAAGNLFPKTRN